MVRHHLLHLPQHSEPGSANSYPSSTSDLVNISKILITTCPQANTGDFTSTDQKMLDELRKISEALEPKPAAPVPPPPKGLWNEFKDFLSKYKVLGLAIAFIMGVYLGGLVQSLVSNLLLPAIGLAIPGLGNLATWTIPVPKTALDGKGIPIDPNYSGQLFGIGGFLVALITFIIVAFVIFLVVKIAKRWKME